MLRSHCKNTVNINKQDISPPEFSTLIIMCPEKSNLANICDCKTAIINMEFKDNMNKMVECGLQRHKQLNKIMKNSRIKKWNLLKKLNEGKLKS